MILLFYMLPISYKEVVELKKYIIVIVIIGLIIFLAYLNEKDNESIDTYNDSYTNDSESTTQENPAEPDDYDDSDIITFPPRDGDIIDNDPDGSKFNELYNSLWESW